MQRNNLVDIRGEKVSLKQTTFAPLELRQKIGEIKLGLDAVGHLLGTVHCNLSTEEQECRVFQRGSWTHRLSPKNRLQLETQISEYLGRTDAEVRAILESFEDDSANEEQLIAGVGLFYFETDTF
jgi:hypothetical protein